MPAEPTSNAAVRLRPHLRALLPAAMTVMAFALLYLWTLDDGLRPSELEGGDLITHQYAQVQGRPSNAPGYPLYTMGGWLWFRLGRLVLGPEANPIPILSGYSTLWALLGLWLLYRLIIEVTDGRYWPLAVLATAFYGVTYFFWYYAVTTEQYTSAVAWTLGVLLLAFRWARACGQGPEPGVPWESDGRPALPQAPHRGAADAQAPAAGQPARRWLSTDRYLLALALLTGIGLAHQVTVLFVIPPLLWLILRRQPGLLRRPALLAAAAGLVLLPLLSYIYVYARGAAHPEWRGAGQWTSASQWFWSFISTGQGRSELTWSLQPILTDEFPSLIWGEMSWPALLVGLLGWAATGKRRAAVIYVTFVIYLAFCWVDRLGNWYQVIMPLYALLAVGLAAAAAWLVRRAAAWRWPRGRISLQPGVSAFVALGLVALIAWRASVSWPRADASNRVEDTGLRSGQAILADDPPQGTAILGTTPEALALNYMTQIWGLRPDVRSVSSREARDLLRQGQMIAATEASLPLVPAEVDSAARYTALGRTLVALRLEPLMTLPDGLHPATYDFGPLRLAGLRSSRNAVTGELVVLLAWQAVEAPAEDWSVSVRLTAGEREIAQLDRHNPAGGAYPTSRWLPGEIVTDAYPFAIGPNDAPDGVTVLLYRQDPAGGFVNLGVARLRL